MNTLKYLQKMLASIPVETKKFYGSDDTYEYRENADAVICVDGFSASIQASKTHYCRPRENRGPWTHVEVGFPRDDKKNRIQVRAWDEFSDGDPETTDVYAWVPLELVAAWIDRHGGVLDDETRERVKLDAQIKALKEERNKKFPRCPYGHELTGTDRCNGTEKWCGFR